MVLCRFWSDMHTPCLECLSFDNFNLFCSYLSVYIYSPESLKKSFHAVCITHIRIKNTTYGCYCKDNNSKSFLKENPTDLTKI